MLYRILTEDKGNNNIERLTAEQFRGFTTYHGTGFWRGTPEPCIIVEVDAPTSDEPKVRRLCSAICAADEQEAVALQIIETQFKLITR